MTPQQTKDLLVHAAKAAGLEEYTFQEATPLQSAMMVRRNIDEHGWDIGVQDFDPINNDADAFGLQCHKYFDVIYVCGDSVFVSNKSASAMEYFHHHGGDIKAATRLAITKAAAMTEGWRE